MKAAMCIASCVAVLLVFGFVLFMATHNAAIGDNPAAYVTTYGDLFVVMYTGVCLIALGALVGTLISI